MQVDVAAYFLRKETYEAGFDSPSLLPKAFLQPSHLQLMEHPTPPLMKSKNKTDTKGPKRKKVLNHGRN